MLKTILVIMATIAVNIFAAEPTFTPKQLADLKTTGRTIIVPNYIPDGFQVKKVVVNRKESRVPSYQILFAGPDVTCFVVEMGTELGDCIIDDASGKLYKPTSTVTMFGEKTEIYKTPDFYGTCFTSPPGESAGYRIVGDGEVGAICKKRLSITEFKKVAQSLSIIQ